MRGNSGFLRLVVVVGCLMVCSVSGGPPRPRRMMRETFSSPTEEVMPVSVNKTSDSDDMCSHNGKEVLRSSVVCEKKNGCREIETNGECCPRFLCECKLNGTVYDNGDKIVNPANPCEVCVCRGGEINCNALQCYSRNDCKNVTYTPGVCCPEYANCPPLENVELNSSNETTTTESTVSHSSSSSTTIPSETSTTSLPTTSQTSTQSNDLQPPVGIKIKEITKPEEIRITDDRPKVFKTIKSSEATRTSSALHSQEMLIEPENEPSPALPSDELEEMQMKIEPEIEQYTTFSFDSSDDDEPIQLESTDLNTVGHVSMGPKIVRQTDIGMRDVEVEVHTTIAPFPSENEISDEESTTGPFHVTEGPMIESSSVKHNTSVLQVGDSVVIFDRSGQTQSISLDVVGLQRGDTGDTDVEEDDEHKDEPKREDSEQYSTAEIETSSTGPSTTFEKLLGDKVFDVEYYAPLDVDIFSGDDASGDYSSGSSSSELPNISTTTDDIDTSSGYSPIDTFTDIMLAQPSTLDEKRVSYYIDSSSSTSEEVSTNFDSFTSSSQLYPLESTTTTTTTADIDEDTIQQEQNINFPHITDDLSIHGWRMEDRLEDDDKMRMNGRVMEGNFEKMEMKPLDQNIINTNDDQDDSPSSSSSSPSSTVAPPLEGSNESGANFKDVEGRSPGEPLLIPEWERNHTTVAPSIELLPSNETTVEQSSSADLSSHEEQTVDTIVADESTTNESDLSSSTNFIDASSSTTESDDSSPSLSQARETNNFNLFLDGTADFFRIQKSFWDSAVV